MTVRELIEKLQTFKPDTYVVVDGYEEGCDDPVVTTIKLVLDSNWNGTEKTRGYAGLHDYAAPDNLAAQEVVRIGRGW
jgi:hypothetical protein